MKRTIVFIILFFCFQNFAFSQSFLHNNPKKGFLIAGFNSDAFVGAELGAASTFDSLLGKNLLTFIRLRLPVFLDYKNKSVNDWEIQTGANFELVRKNKVGLLLDFFLFTMRHKQVLGTFLPVGVNLALTPCFHFSKGYAGIQFTWNQTLVTHIQHSEYVQETYEDLYGYDKKLPTIKPRNGWYAATGSSSRLGLECAFHLIQKANLYFDMGFIYFSSPFTGAFDAMMIGQVPFYANFRLLYEI